MEELDRTKVCPFLLRCYWKMSRHNVAGDYRHAARDIFPTNEIIIYTWQDATLRELTILLSDAIDKLGHPQCQVSFAAVYPDHQGTFIVKPIGDVHVNEKGPDDEKTLKSLNFMIGDYLDIAVTVKDRPSHVLTQPEPQSRSISYNSGREVQGNGRGRGDRNGRGRRF